MSHLYEARELINKYPLATRKLSLLEVERIWEEYSDSMAAGWMIPDDESVQMVFSHYNKRIKLN